MFGIPQKKARTEAPKAAAPRLFVPFRAIGYVTNEIPFNIQAKGQAYFLTTCVGTTFHIYDVAKMNLLFVGTCYGSTQSKPRPCPQAFVQLNAFET